MRWRAHTLRARRRGKQYEVTMWSVAVKVECQVVVHRTDSYQEFERALRPKRSVEQEGRRISARVGKECRWRSVGFARVLVARRWAWSSRMAHLWR